MAYTPFLTQAGAAIGRGMEARGIKEQKAEQNRLAGQAYMGDPKAIEQLMQVNPELGVQVQQQTQKRKTESEQQEMQKRTQFKKEYGDLMGNIAKFESFEEAKSYADTRITDIGQRYPDIMAQVGEDAVFDEEDFQLAKKLGGGAGTDQVQSSKILPGGLVQNVMKSGKIMVVEPDEANIQKIKEAEERGAELQGLRAGERGAASSAIKESVKAFQGMVGVRKKISLYGEGIRLLEKEGADTGAIEKMFPSFKAATVELDNVQANLGLNVIQNTTFGSLSEQELKFALSSTMPQALDSPELADWMKRKREAQMKLSEYLEKAAVFLGTPGNSIADFIKLQKQEQKDDDLTPEEQAELEQLRKEVKR